MYRCAKTLAFFLVFSCGLLSAASPPVFTAGKSYTTAAGPLASIVGDFNGDGNIDLVVSNTAADTVSVFLGVGDGTFRPRIDYMVAGCQVGQVITGDFNRDGNLDLLGTCTLTTQIFVLPGKGDGTFGAAIRSNAPLPIVSGFLENFVQPLSTADVNGDGILDLALIIQTSQIVSFSSSGAVGQAIVMTGKGDGTFGNPVTLDIAPTGTEPYAVQFADVDGDGKPDIVGIAFDYSSTGLSSPPVAFFFVALGSGSGAFHRTETYPLAGIPQTGMLLGDVNGDGKIDVVFAGLSIAAILNADVTDFSGVGVFLGNGDGSFKLGYTVIDSQAQFYQGTIGAALAPVFGTRVPDIIGVMFDQAPNNDAAVTGNLVVRPNNGDGTFGAPQNLTAPSATLPFSIAVADFNGDGSPDIVSFNFTVNLFTLLFGSPALVNSIDAIGQTIVTFPPATATVLLNGTPSSTFTDANSASFKAGGVGASSIVSAFGTKLASSPIAATQLPLPTALGGASISVMDSLGISRSAPLFYVSPTQINYEIPDGTAVGASTVSIATPTGIVTARQTIVGVAPGIFNATGLAAGNVFTYNNSATPVVTSTISSIGGQLAASPIDVGSGSTQVYLILYGTGIRGHLSPVTATIGTTSVPAAYAGAQGTLVGEDQINILLPQSLKGSGLISLTLTADGETTNPVQISIQ